MGLVHSKVGTDRKTFDVVIVGAGFAGVYATHKFTQMGMSVILFEKGPDLGGTWFWNAYPGARCDVESIEYSYQSDPAIEQEWNWTERYPAQEEIHRYINFAADRWDVRKYMHFNRAVTSAHFDADASVWHTETDDGQRFLSKYCLMLTGPLSAPIFPTIEGLDTFEGEMTHTGLWPREGIELAGKRVGIIGTGSSGAQSLAAISEVAGHTYLFQRTPSYVVPANNHPLDADVQTFVKANYRTIREKAWTTRAGLRYSLGDRMALEYSEDERNQMYEASWQRGGIGFTATFFDLFDTLEANETACKFVRKKIHQLVKDPVTAEALCPYDPIGCRRLIVCDGFYEAFNRDNVSLVDVSESPIERIVPEGIVVAGKTYELDVILLATGFDFLDGALSKIDIEGKNGLKLSERMKSDPKALMGMTFSDFPNLFTVNGPGAVAALGNMVPLIEYSIDWIADAITHLTDSGNNTMEPLHADEDAWATYVDEMAQNSLYVACRSYYLGDNVPGKPRKFLLFQGVPEYVEKCNQIAAEGYRAFSIN